MTDADIRGRAPSATWTLRGLLEEPAFGTWAKETASERRITPLEALGLLAQALCLDAQP
jgi:hypothetical protein